MGWGRGRPSSSLIWTWDWELMTQSWCCFSHPVVSDSFVTPWIGIFPGKNTGMGCRFLSPGDLPNQGTELASPALQEDSLLLSHWGSPSDTEWAAALGGACASSQGQQHFPGVCSVCCGHLTRAPWSPSRVPRIQNNGQRRTQTSPHAGRKGLGHATGGRELGELWIWGKGDNRQEWTF